MFDPFVDAVHYLYGKEGLRKEIKVQYCFLALFLACTLFLLYASFFEGLYLYSIIALLGAYYSGKVIQLIYRLKHKLNNCDGSDDGAPSPAPKQRRY